MRPMRAPAYEGSAHATAACTLHIDFKSQRTGEGARIVQIERAYNISFPVVKCVV